MGRYIDWDDVVLRYPSIDNIGGAAEVGSAWIGSIENQIDGMLSKSYSIPFSSNNETVKDLAIELTYIRVGNLKVEEADSMKTNFMDRIERIINGREGLVSSDGSIVGMVGDTIWSSTKDYHPIFDIGCDVDWVTDSSQVDAIDNAKL